MAWNTPGGNGTDGPADNRRGARPPRGGNGGGWGRLPGPLRDLFDGGIWRWALVAVALLVLLSSFQ